MFKLSVLKVVLLIIALLLIIVGFILFIFPELLGISGPGTSPNTTSPVVETMKDIVTKQEALIDSAISGKNPDLCNGVTSKSAQLVCKVFSSAAKGDASLCEQDLSGYDNVNYEINKKSINLSPNDFCWLKMSTSLKIDYCSKIASSQKNIICSYITNKIK